MNHELALRTLMADPKFRATVSAHARIAKDQTPSGKVRESVHAAVSKSQFAPHADAIADRAKEHAAAASGEDDAQKVSKTSVDYRSGNVAEHCGNCSMYRDHFCTLVRGLIDPSFTCKRWQAQAASPDKQQQRTGSAASQRPTSSVSSVSAPRSVLKNARRAKDGKLYVPDPKRPGKYLMVVDKNNSGGGAPGPSTLAAKQTSSASASPRGGPPENVNERQHPQMSANGNMRQVELWRHGATHLNDQDTSVDRIRAWKDVPLTAEGRAEAQKSAEKAAHNPPHAIVSSDLCRARESAEIISKITGAPIVAVSQAFRPWNAGKLAGQLSKKAVPLMGQYAEHRPDTPLPGGESFNCFRGRYFNGVNDALNSIPGTVAIVSHHRGERLMHAWRAAGYPPTGDIDLKTFNTVGELPGAVTAMEIPHDRVRAVAQHLGRQPQTGESANAAVSPRPVPNQTRTRT